MFHILPNETDFCCTCICWSRFLCAPAPLLTINVWQIVLITIALVYHARQFHSCNWCVMLVWYSFCVEVCECFLFALVFFVRSSVLLKVACFFYNLRLVCPCYSASWSFQISHVPFEVKWQLYSVRREYFSHEPFWFCHVYYIGRCCRS